MRGLKGALAALAVLGGLVEARTSEAQATAPQRTPLAVIPLKDVKRVSRVVTTRVDFAPGQIMPTHTHTVPVVCFVTQGAFLTRIGAEPETLAPAGSVTFEPPEVVVHYFKNASGTAPAQLECASLAGADDHILNVMTPQ